MSEHISFVTVYNYSQLVFQNSHRRLNKRVSGRFYPNSVFIRHVTIAPPVVVRVKVHGLKTGIAASNSVRYTHFCLRMYCGFMGDLPVFKTSRS
jgi:hypothetical protein